MKTDNELIAEFMDGTTFDSDGLCTDPEKKYSWRPGCYDSLKVEHLAYHNNWNWLMPVVEKIDSLNIEEFNIDEFDNQIEILLKLDIFTPIDKVYKAIVEFIKWYNEQPH